MLYSTNRWRVCVCLGILVLILIWLSQLFTDRRVDAGGGGEPGWQHLSTADGDLPAPASNDQQTLALILDVDRDGVNDFVIGSRRPPGPSLVWFRRGEDGWTRYTIEADVLTLEAGGAFHDLDGDGDLDVVGGSDSKSNKIWWWENPYPDYAPSTGWERREIKNSGATKHHDMIFGQFDDDPAVEFVYWNQGAKKLLIVEVPDNPTVQPWPDGATVFDSADGKSEGLAQADVDGDGKMDIVGGGYWFKHLNGNNFAANQIRAGSLLRVAAGQLIPGGWAEIVQVPGDADGPARWFEWDGSEWDSHELPIGDVRHGHSLAIGDVNGDGHLDIFIGEMRTMGAGEAEYPDARTILLLGDGEGGWTTEVVATGYEHHESTLGDLDGDGDLDILGKSFRWDTPRLDIWLNNESTDDDDDPPGCQLLDRWQTHVIDSGRPWRAVFIDSADIDGDGFEDIVSGAWWYRNPGSPGGVWTRAEIGAPLNEMALIYDFDGDGDPDVLGTVRESGASQPHFGSEFVWGRNDGAGQFTILDNIEAGDGDFLQGAVAGSFAPGNGKQVILSWHRGNVLQGLTVPGNPAAGQWDVGTAVGTTQNEELSAGDIDRDGDLDLILGTVWLENRAGSWAAHTLHNTANHPDRNRLADIDNDGRLDVVIGYEAINATGKLAWYRAPADPADDWTEEVIASISGPMSLDVGDADGDGDLDVVVGEHNTRNSNVGRVLLFEQDGGEWVQHLVANGAEHHDGTQFVDIDNDGDRDVISIGWTHDDVYLYEQLGCDAPQPTRTPTPTPGAPTVTPTTSRTATPGTPTVTPTSSRTPTPTPSATTGSSGALLYLSSKDDGRVGNVDFANEDILRFDAATAQWALLFDGSDVGLAARNVDAFHLLPDGRLLLSLDIAETVTDLGRVDDSDVLAFTPRTLGENTSGSFAVYFDGSDVGLSTNAEDVDGLALTATGELVISTVGNFNVQGINAYDEDLLRFTPAKLGSATAGEWSLAFDGSAAGLTKSSEDVAAVGLDADGAYQLTTVGYFAVGGLRGGAGDVFACGDGCSPAHLYWSGAYHSFAGGIDALHVTE